MSLEHIIKNILSDADAEAERIMEETRKKAAQVEKTAGDEAERAAASVIEEAERQARLESGRILTKARLDSRLSVLACKKELIGDVLKKAFSKQDRKPGTMEKEVVLKEGVRKEALDEKRLLDEIRPQVESEIAKILKI